MALGAAGCAADYVDSRGVRHVIGLVHVAIGPDDPDITAGGWVDVTSIGIAVSRGELESGIAIGYARRTTAAFRDHAVAQGPFGANLRDILTKAEGL